MKVKTIRVPLESYVYLNNYSDFSKKGKELVKDELLSNDSDYYEKHFLRESKDYKDKLAIFFDDDFAIIKNGKRVYLKADDMAKILKAADLPYKPGEDSEVTIIF